VIRWRHPSTAPRDGSHFAVVAANGELAGCTLDEEQDGYVIVTLAPLGNRLAHTLTGYIGWAPWPEIFAHIRDTANTVDAQEVTDARIQAWATVSSLTRFVRDHDEEKKTLALETIKTIERLLAVLPPGD
jgi:hypothetical protein